MFSLEKSPAIASSSGVGREGERRGGEGGGEGGSAAPAPLHHHLLVVFQDHLVILIQVEHGNGAQLRGHAAGLGDAGVHRVHQRLHDGVVGGVEVVGQREGTVPVAVKRLVPRGCHDPVVPAHVAEIHIEGMAAAVFFVLAGTLVFGAPASSAGQRVASPVVPKSDQERPELSPVPAPLR